MTLCRNVRRRRGHNSVSAVYKIPQPCFSRLFLCVYRLHVLGLLPAAYPMQLGFLGLIIGAAFAGLAYVIIAVAVKIAGVKWINKIMPAVVIRPHRCNNRSFPCWQRNKRPLRRARPLIPPTGSFVMDLHTGLHNLRPCHPGSGNAVLRIRQRK